ncbi:MAG TPA: PfkB family carbohydrate kinase [Candidatus Acidoferrales bacterium]|nr:PfkB family carbohydrate kinase [Candidatus Acidoferrales bacterium]
MSLLVVGSIALDTIETPFGRADRVAGGSAVYISAAASYFTAPIRLVGVVGSDFPDSELKFLESRGIDLAGIQVVEGGKTFFWSGRYHYDLNERDTIDTQLNVFEKFNPVLPESYRKSKYLILGNIDPVLQLRVIDSMEQRPELIVCDTMNFWIKGKNKELMETLKRVDVLIVNDSEARLLVSEPNLVKAAKKITKLGPPIVIIKKGEHGALLFTSESVFAAPAFPLEFIYDPTGAGDTFAGGFIGHLARTEDLSDHNLRKATVYGSVMASFGVGKFGTEALKNLSDMDIHRRYRDFIELSRFDE